MMLRSLPLSPLALAPLALALGVLAPGLAFAQDIPLVEQEARYAAFDDDDDESADGLLVDFKDGLDNDDIAKMLARAGVTLTDTTDAADGNLFLFRGSPAEVAGVVKALEGNRAIEGIEPNVHYSLFNQDLEVGAALDAPKPGPGKPNDPMYKSQWHMDMVNAEGAWAVTQGGGVIVAVIDTGVSPGLLPNGKKSKFKRVPDLKETEIVAGFNFVDNNQDPSDGNGHGTHVAGTISQATNNAFGVVGLAPKSKIMPIKVLSDRGSGTVADIANGIRFAADNGAKVINMSLGGGMYSSTLARAVKYAHDKGVTVACAAGNGSRQKVEYPAAYDGCVAVSALGPDGKLAFYSSYGKELDIAAPGGDTRVDLNKDGLPDGVLQNTIGRSDVNTHGFFPFQGTSMATPHVAAAAALVISAGVTDPDRVEKVLKESSKKLNDPIRYGAGGLDAAAAVKKASRDHAGGGLAIAVVLAGLGLSRARRRDGWMSTAKATPGMAIGALLGSGALLAFAPEGLGAWAGWMALVAAGVVVVPFVFLFGMKSARGTLAGLGFGVAGFALVRAVLGSVDVALVPGHGMLDMAFLLGTAGLAAIIGAISLRR
ncbi:MAG: S8 family peptidase [Deltaproteobacteria bacterium]|nr:S8 family peptidase [Deltaproteobacteria bacterium]